MLSLKVNLKVKLSKIKPLHAEWLVKVYTDMQDRGSLIKKGFQKAGFTNAFLNKFNGL